MNFLIGEKSYELLDELLEDSFDSELNNWFFYKSFLFLILLGKPGEPSSLKKLVISVLKLLEWRDFETLLFFDARTRTTYNEPSSRSFMKGLITFNVFCTLSKVF